MAQRKIVVGCPGCGSAMRLVREEEAQAHKWKGGRYVYCTYEHCSYFEHILKVVKDGFVWAGRLWNDGGG